MDDVYTRLRHEITKRDGRDRQIEDVTRYIVPCFIPILSRLANEDLRYTVKKLMDELKAEYLSAGVSVRGYCELSMCLKLIEIRHADRRALGLFMGYVSHGLASDGDRQAFNEAYRKDIEALGPKDAHRLSLREAVGEDPDPLGGLLKAMIRATLTEEDDGALRDLIFWTYAAHRPVHRRLLSDSLSYESWRCLLGEIIPTLLLKNFIPFKDQVQTKRPQITFFERKSRHSPMGMTDSGRLTRHSTLFRALFGETDLKRFDKEDQRISELFAHCYANILHDTSQEQHEALEAKVIAMASENRLLALQYLESQYRYSLVIPRCRYLKIKDRIISAMA